MSISMKSTKHFGFENNVHATKGPKGDTAFLEQNYRYMQIGSIFRTPKARFTHKQVHAGAKKAGAIVEIVEEGPWLRVKMIGKIKPAPRKPEPQTVYFGAGKEYPPPPRTISIARSVEITPTSTSTSTPNPAPGIDIFS